MADDDVVVRRRDDGALELRVNGVFVMDDVETTSERRLAQVVLDHGARDVLVGGLGLGFTVRTLLADDRVRRVVVAELHPEVVAANGLVDPRLDVVIGDVRDLCLRNPTTVRMRSCSTSTTAPTRSSTPGTRPSTRTHSWPNARAS